MDNTSARRTIVCRRSDPDGRPEGPGQVIVFRRHCRVNITVGATYASTVILTASQASDLVDALVRANTGDEPPPRGPWGGFLPAI